MINKAFLMDDNNIVLYIRGKNIIILSCSHYVRTRRQMWICWLL